jgi:hypothetical protein
MRPLTLPRTRTLPCCRRSPVGSYTLRQSMFVGTKLGCSAWASRSKDAYRRAAASITGRPLGAVGTPRCLCRTNGRLRVTLQVATGRITLNRARAMSQALNGALVGGRFWQSVRSVAGSALQPSKGDGYCVVGRGPPSCPALTVTERCAVGQLRG